MWAEEFSHFSSLALQKLLQFLVHVHVSFHNSASHSICAAQTEWLTFKMNYSDIYMTWVTPKTKAESYHEDFKSLLVVHKKNHSERKEVPRKTGQEERFTCTAQECWWLHQMQVSPHQELTRNHSWSLWCSPHLFALKDLQGSIAWNIYKPTTGLSRIDRNFMNHKQ